MSNTTIRVIIDGKGSISGLAPVNSGLKGVEDQAKKTRDTVNKAVKFDFTASIPGLKGLQNNISGVSSAASALKNVVAGGLVGAAFVRGISAAVDKSVEFQNALIGVNSVARAFGVNSDDVKEAILDFTKDGLINATDAALAFKQVLSTGTELPTAIKLLNSLKDTAAFNRQSFYSLGEAVIATTEGIKNGNSVRADAVGVTKNLSVLEKEYAASLGRTVGSLTEQEKTLARVTGFIREGAFAQGDAAKLSDTYSGSVSKLSTSFDRLLARTGDFITKATIVRGLIGGLASGFDFFAKVLTENSPEQKLAKMNAELRQFDNIQKLSAGAYSKNAASKREAITKEIDNLKDSIFYSKLSSSEQQTNTKKEIDLRTKAAAVTKKIGEDSIASAKALKKIEEKYKFGGDDELTKLKKIRDIDLKLAGRNADLKLLIEREYTKNVDVLNKKLHDNQVLRANELAKLNKLIGKEALIDAAKNPLGTAQRPEGLTEQQRKTFDKNNAIGTGVGLLNNIAGGREGAKALVVSAAGLALDSMVPGLGQAAQPLLAAFAEGPKATRAMVKEFMTALPDIIKGYYEALPVFVEELANQSPILIERLAAQMPQIIGKLVAASPKIAIALASHMPKVAVKFAEELIRNIPKIASAMAKQIGDAIKKIISQVTGGLAGGKGGVGGAIGGVKDKVNGFTEKTFGFKFAKGGEVSMARGGSPFKDSIPASLMDGELVVDRNTTGKLKKALDSGMGGSDIKAELRQIISLLSRPQEVSTEVKFNNESFAKIILQLNRTNQRLA